MPHLILPVAWTKQNRKPCLYLHHPTAPSAAWAHPSGSNPKTPSCLPHGSCLFGVHSSRRRGTRRSFCDHMLACETQFISYKNKQKYVSCGFNRLADRSILNFASSVNRSRGLHYFPSDWRHSPVTPLDATRVNETMILTGGSTSNWCWPVQFRSLKQQIDTWRSAYTRRSKVGL